MGYELTYELDLPMLYVTFIFTKPNHVMRRTIYAPEIMEDNYKPDPVDIASAWIHLEKEYI